MQIKYAFTLPQIYKPISFYLLMGITVPSFGDFNYYFIIEVLQISKFVLSLLAIVGFVTLLIGIAIYSKYLEDKETRTLIKFAILINIIGEFFQLMLVLRVNLILGINDLAFILFSNVVTEVCSMGLYMMPSLILFAKITPMYIEATVFSMLSGLFNLSRGILSSWIGIMYNNLFVGITTQNLENFYILILIALCLSPMPFLFVRLIPTN